MAGNANESGVVHFDVKLDGKGIPDGVWQSFSIDRDLNQPDMATVVLTNTNDAFTKDSEPGQAVEIAISQGEKLFQGEIVGLEPIYKGKGESKIVVRCFNKLHRLLRGRTSKTYNDKSDRQIIAEILGKHGLTLDWKGPEIVHNVVYQHNQTDLEFVRIRAARLGLNVWCTDTNVAVKEPVLDEDSKISYTLIKGNQSAEQIRVFMPRLSSAPVVKKVIVRGWDEEKKALIVGEASADSSKLGAMQSSAAAKDHGKAETFTVDQPIRSVAEAKALAKARLTELSLGYITGELEVLGSGKLVPGLVISVKVSPEKADKFNGKYFIAGVSHRFTPDSNGEEGGFVSTCRLQRDAQGPSPGDG